AEKQAGQRVHTLHEGRVVRNTLLSRVGRAVQLGPVGRSVLCTVVPVLASWGAALVGGHRMTVGAALAWLGVVLLALCAAAYLHRANVAPLSEMLRWANR